MTDLYIVIEDPGEFAEYDQGRRNAIVVRNAVNLQKGEIVSIALPGMGMEQPSAGELSSYRFRSRGWI